MKKSKNVPQDVKDEVAQYLIDHPKATGRVLKKEVEKSLKRKMGRSFRYTERTYQNIKNKMDSTPRELDNPWSLGSCLKDGVKDDIAADTVLPIQQQLLPYGLFLTIRRARWYSLLHPLLLPLLEKAYPGQTSQNQIRLLQIASFYTRIEQIADIRKDDRRDTRTLDNKFIFSQGFSFGETLKVWGDLYLHVPDDPVKVTKFPASGQRVEEKLAKEVTAGEAKLLNRFISLISAGDLDKASALVEKNPDIQPLVEKWMVFSLRRDVKITKKDGE